MDRFKVLRIVAAILFTGYLTMAAVDGFRGYWGSVVFWLLLAWLISSSINRKPPVPPP